MTFHRPQALSTRPTVSVVVPCYRYGNYLPFAVGSVSLRPTWTSTS